MSVDEILKGLKSEEEITLPDDLPYNENAEFLSITAKGKQELTKYKAQNKRDRKTLMLTGVYDLEPQIKSGNITLEEGIRKFRGYKGGETEWNAGFASQKIRELINEGSLVGNPWFLKFDIEKEDYRNLLNVVEGGYTTLSSLATRLHEPEEKIRKMGGELAKRGIIFAFPGTVTDNIYSYRMLPKTHADEPDKIEYPITTTKPVIFLDSEGNETREAFLPKSMKKEGIKTANRTFMERVLLSNLKQIEEEKLEVLKRKMKPTINGVIHPLTIDVGNARRIYNAALDYMPSLQMYSLIDYDFDSLRNIFNEKEFESVNRAPWAKKRFDKFSNKDDRKKTFDDSRRDKYHKNLFGKHVSKVRGDIQTSQQFFPSLNTPEINNSEENENKSAYMFFVAYCSKFASKYDKGEKGLLGISEPDLDRVGVLRLTERGRKILEGVSFFLPYVEITHTPFLSSSIAKPFKLSKI